MLTGFLMRLIFRGPMSRSKWFNDRCVSTLVFIRQFGSLNSSYSRRNLAHETSLWVFWNPNFCSASTLSANTFASRFPRSPAGNDFDFWFPFTSRQLTTPGAFAAPNLLTCDFFFLTLALTVLRQK